MKKPDGYLKIKEGSLVRVVGGFGTEKAREVTVSGVGEKNGQMVFDYNDHVLGFERWAYTDQILEVIEY